MKLGNSEDNVTSYFQTQEPSRNKTCTRGNSGANRLAHLPTCAYKLASRTNRLVHDKLRAFETGRLLPHLKNATSRVKEKPWRIQTVIVYVEQLNLNSEL
jgi:hypothetical protein